MPSEEMVPPVPMKATFGLSVLLKGMLRSKGFLDARSVPSRVAPPPMTTTSCCAGMAALPREVLVHLRRHVDAVALGDAAALVAQVAGQPSGPGIAQLLDQRLDAVQKAVAEAPGIDQQQELSRVRRHGAWDLSGLILEAEPRTAQG